jgi:8-amino-7-oxononanoate synthase
VRLYGAGSGASALISGYGEPQRLLEERLAAWAAPHIPGARALGFGTGYMANLAVVSALGDGRRGAVLRGAEPRQPDRRRAPGPRRQAGLPQRRRWRAQLEASQAAHKVIVSDAVFSMDGHLAPLPELLRLAERHAALLVVDDAHGFGVLGAQGHGSLSHFGLCSERLVWMGTLGKAAGVAGAFVAAHPTVIEWLLQTARPFIFTTAPPPLLAHALLTSLDLIEGEEGERRRDQLELLRAQLRAGLAESAVRGAWLARLALARQRHAHPALDRGRERGRLAARRATGRARPARAGDPPAHRAGRQRALAHHPVRHAHRSRDRAPAASLE